MKIIVDAMGGDNAPLEIVKGALQGRARWGVDIVLTGDATQILRALEECGEKTVPQGVEIANATQTVEMCDDPATVFRHKKDTSMGVGLTMLRDGKADVGVVPVENTTAGTVSAVYDLLLDYDLSVNRSYIKKISHCLAAVPGATMSDIKSVCSHPHALPQCSAFISEHGFTAIEMANTAIAAQSVRDKGDPSLAAICSREAAERYGLTVLAEGINDMKHNETRFIAVSRTPTCLPEDNRIEIAFRIPNVAGSLITVLDIIAHYGVDMTEIHSRPLKDSPWCYVFYVDFTGNINDHAVRSLLYQLHEELPYIKVIGSYKVD